MNDSIPYRMPREPGRWRAIGLAAVVHAALFAFLWFGVSWQNDTPVAVEAEVWNLQAREAAPRAQVPPPAPPSVAAPVPVPKAAPVPDAPAPKLEAPQPKAPDIALEQERKRRELQRIEEQAETDARRQMQARLKLAEAKKQKAQEAREQEAAQKRAVQVSQAADALARKKLDAEKKLDADKRLVAEKKLASEKQLVAEKQARLAAANDQKLAALHDEQVRRLTDSAAVGSGGNGDAARSQGMRADTSYIQKVGAKIKSNTIFNGAEELTSNPAVEFAVELLPDGSIRRLRKTRSSGVPGFDEAVSRAIEKSQPFPPDKSGTAPSAFTVSHRPKDQ